MKSLFSIVLSILLLLPSFGSFFVYTSFKLNQNEIAKTICVQRKLVNNTCNGRCELQKSLKKYDDNEKRMDNTNLKEKTELVYTVSTLAYNFKTVIAVPKKETVFSDFCKKPKMVSLTIFHPPLA